MTTAERRRSEKLTKRGHGLSYRGCTGHKPILELNLIFTFYTYIAPRLKMIRVGTDQSFVRREEGSMVHPSYGAGISPGIDSCLVSPGDV